MPCLSFAEKTACPVTLPHPRAGPERLPAAIALPLAALLAREMRQAVSLAALDRALRAYGYCLRVDAAGVTLHSWPTGGMICRLQDIRQRFIWHGTARPSRPQ